MSSDKDNGQPCGQASSLNLTKVVYGMQSIVDCYTTTVKAFIAKMKELSAKIEALEAAKKGMIKENSILETENKRNSAQPLDSAVTQIYLEQLEKEPEKFGMFLDFEEELHSLKSPIFSVKDRYPEDNLPKEKDETESASEERASVVLNTTEKSGEKLLSVEKRIRAVSQHISFFESAIREMEEHLRLNEDLIENSDNQESNTAN